MVRVDCLVSLPLWGRIWVRGLLEMGDILGNLLQPPLAHRASELGGALGDSSLGLLQFLRAHNV